MSSESSLASTSPSAERSEGREVKGQGKSEARRQDYCFLLKRKRRSIEEEEVEEGGPERRDDHKRSRSGELLDFVHKHPCALSPVAEFVCYILSDNLSVQSQQQCLSH